MSLPALTLAQLAQMMRDLAARANDPSLRFYREDDAALAAKLSLLDAICEPLWMDDRMSDEQENELLKAKSEADRAWSRLQDAMEAAKTAAA